MALPAFIIALVASYNLGWSGVAVTNCVLNLLSFGILSNFRDDPQSAPDWASTLNLLTSIFGLVLLAYSFL